MFKNILQGYILNQKISKIDYYVIVLKLKKKITIEDLYRDLSSSSSWWYMICNIFITGKCSQEKTALQYEYNIFYLK